MNSRDLETFLAVAESTSVSQAAFKLHLTQPAVTRRIQSLEQSVGTPLFDRVGKRLLLTQAGELLLPRARHILEQWAESERQIHNLTDEVSGSLNLATSHHIGLHHLGPVLRRYRETYPQVQLNIVFEDSEVAHDLVRRGQIELAVATLDPTGNSDMHTTPVWIDPLEFVADAKLLALAAPYETLALAELARLPAVLPGTTTYTGRIVVQRFQEAGITLQPAMSTNYLETLGMLVQAGLGWSVLPRSMSGSLDILRVECAAMSRTLGMLRSPHRSISNAGVAFAEVLQEFTNLGAPDRDRAKTDP